MVWKVVPLSEGQRQDVRPGDVLEGGLYRHCETYRGGGGYDQFPRLAAYRFGHEHHRQFVVQIKGCHLDCPYCYVTREGVWGTHENRSSTALVEAFNRARESHGCTVFHLMGGAPALQLKQWPALLATLSLDAASGWVFHSDLLLTEAPYDEATLRAVAHPRALYAVDVKGLTDEEHRANTRKPFQRHLFWLNLERIERACLPYYVTFTAVSDPEPFWATYRALFPEAYETRRAEAFSIDLIDYDAQPFVDRVPWGGNASDRRAS